MSDYVPMSVRRWLLLVISFGLAMAKLGPSEEMLAGFMLGVLFVVAFLGTSEARAR